jgi:RNA polymerase sigma factor (sigma-70 family)
MEGLSALELEVYNSRFLDHSSEEETLHRVQSRFPDVVASDVLEIEEHLEGSLTSRQRWMLGRGRRPEVGTSAAVLGGEGEAGTIDFTDPSPNQEMQVSDQELYGRLRKSVGSLPARERLLLQLRYEQDLSLEEIARLCGLDRAQSVHRMLASILNKLRHAMK